MLLGTERVIKFIGTDEYKSYKEEKFKGSIEPDITKNSAFQLNDGDELEKFCKLYDKKSEIYFGEPPRFQDILSRINSYAESL